jgi:hypothetical protein
VALCVVGDVNQQASYGGWQLLLSYGSRCFEIGVGNGTNAFGAVCECCGEFGKQCVASGVGVEFSAQKRQLLICQTSVFGIGQKAIEAARQMADVERDRGGSSGLGVKFGVGEARAPLL